MAPSRSFSLGCALLVAMAACRREEKPLLRTKQRQPQATASGSSAPPRSAEEEAMLTTVRAWNDALHRHDLKKLGELYDKNVRVYGKELSKADALDSKRDLFAKKPRFEHEIIGEVSFSRTEDRITASFYKKAGPPDDFLVQPASLVIVPVASYYLVVEEADEASTRKDRVDRERCDAKATEVFNALPAVKRAYAELEAEIKLTGGSARMGGIGPTDDPQGGFTMSVGMFTDERYAGRLFYAVDRNGHLTVTTSAGPVAIAREALLAVRDACRP